MIPEISNLIYEERLYKCGFLSLEMRRLHSGLILVFEIMKGFANVEADKFFQFLEDPHTRGQPSNNLQIFKQICRLKIKKCTFSQRMITEWNHLPPEAVTAKTVNLSNGVIDVMFQQNMGLYISQRRLSAQFLSAINYC